jgi:hypothetical protein
MVECNQHVRLFSYHFQFSKTKFRVTAFVNVLSKICLYLEESHAHSIDMCNNSYLYNRACRRSFSGYWSCVRGSVLRTEPVGLMRRKLIATRDNKR